MTCCGRLVFSPTGCPTPSGPSPRLHVRLLVGLAGGWTSPLRRPGPTRLGAQRAQPGHAAAQDPGGAPGRGRQRPRLCRPGSHVSSRGWRQPSPPHRTPARSHGRRRSRSCAPSSPSTPHCPSTPAGSVCWPATSSKQASDSRSRWSASASCTAPGTSTSASTCPAAARVLDRRRSRRPARACPSTAPDGEPLRRHVPIQGEDVAASVAGRRRAGAALPARHRRGRRTPVGRWVTSRLYEGNRRVRLAPVRVCSASARRAGARGPWGSSRRCTTSTRGIPPLAACRARPPSGSRAGVHARAGVGGGPRRSVVFTTHTPVAAGNETYSAGEILQVLGPDRGLGRRPERVLLRLGRPMRQPRAPLGCPTLASAHEPIGQRREPPPWGGGAGDVADQLAGPGGRRRPITHVTNGVHLPTWMAPPCASCSTSTSGPAGARRPPTRGPGSR